MTDQEEAREAIFARAGWRCEVCGRPIREGVPQLAHRIPQSKAMLRKYGPEVIHHPDNLGAVCGLRCNDTLDIRNHPLEIAEIVEKITKNLYNQG